jgi:sensor histidine kinase regulating citrate/malate metabolism
MSFVRHLLSHGASWRRIYLQGIDPEEIVTAVRTRRAPMMSASAGLRL